VLTSSEAETDSVYDYFYEISPPGDADKIIHDLKARLRALEEIASKGQQ
jgi:hypothetical protein